MVTRDQFNYKIIPLLKKAGLSRASLSANFIQYVNGVTKVDISFNSDNELNAYTITVDRILKAGGGLTTEFEDIQTDIGKFVVKNHLDFEKFYDNYGGVP